MEICRKAIKYKSRSEVFNLIPLSDIHLGNAGCDIPRFKAMVQWIKDTPNCYWIGLGDYLDSICISDKRFDPLSIDPEYRIKDLSNLVNQQLTYLLTILLPIKDKCICIYTGNHEEALRQHSYIDIGLELARKLDVPYMGYDGFIQLIFKREGDRDGKQPSSSYDIYCTHGFGGSRRSGGKVNKMEDVAHNFDADLVIMAHEHKKIIAPPVLRLGLNSGGKLIQKKQLAVMSGSFLRGYVEGHSSYVERFGYPPTDLGMVRIQLKPDVHDLHASL